MPSLRRVLPFISLLKIILSHFSNKPAFFIHSSARSTASLTKGKRSISRFFDFARNPRLRWHSLYCHRTRGTAIELPILHSQFWISSLPFSRLCPDRLSKIRDHLIRYPLSNIVQEGWREESSFYLDPSFRFLYAFTSHESFICLYHHDKCAFIVDIRSWLQILGYAKSKCGCFCLQLGLVSVLNQSMTTSVTIRYFLSIFSSHSTGICNPKNLLFHP